MNLKHIKNLGIISNAISLIGSSVADVEAVSAAVEGLSAANAAAVLSATELTEVEMAEIMAAKGCSTETALNTLAKAGFTEAESVAALTTAGYTEEIVAATAATVSFAEAEGTATVATSALTSAQAGATAATSGLSVVGKGLFAVMKAHPILAVVSALSIAIPIIKNIVGSVKSAEERIAEFNKTLDDNVKKVQNIASNYRQLKTSADSIIPRFAELSKGVNTFGDNVSLTDEEYQEFLELNNKIAEMFPELNLGMDSNGNAMLALSYGADTLTESLNNLVKAEREAANLEIAKTMPDILDSISGIEKEYNKEIERIEKRKEEWTQVYNDILNQTLPTNVGRFANMDDLKRAYDEFIEKAQKLGMHGGLSIDDQRSTNNGYVGKVVWDYSQVDTTELEKLYKAKLEEESKLIDNYQRQIEAKWKSLNPVVSSWLQTDFLYNDLNDQMQQIANIMVSGLDFNKLGLHTQEDVQNYVTDNIVKPLFLAGDDVKAAFAEISDLQQQLANGEITVDEFKTKVNDAFDGLMSNMDSSALENFKTAFVNGFNDIGVAGSNFDEVLSGLIDTWSQIGVEGKDNKLSISELLGSDTDFSKSIDNYTSKVETLQKALSDLRKGNFSNSDFVKLTKEFPQLAGEADNLDDAIRSLLSGLNSDMISEFSNQFGNLETDEDVAALKRYQESVLELGQVVGDSKFSIDIEAEIDGMNNLFSAMKESVSSTGLTIDSISKLKARYQDLEGYDASQLFERTANGIHLNTKALRQLENEYENSQKALTQKKLQDLTDQYNDLTGSINNCTDSARLAELYSQRQNVLNRINDTAALAAQYEGLTSAFHKWEEAQSLGEEGDMYDSLASGLENIKQLYDDGLVGTNKFRTAVQLMSNEDLSTANIDELIAAYDKGYGKMTRYFQDGSDGCLNFLEDIQKLNSEWAHMNEDGSWEIDFGLGNDQEIADALGINVEAVQSILRKLSDYGFDINLDSIYSAFELLGTKAEEANNKLKELGKTDYTFNFESSSIETVMGDIQKAKELLDTFKTNKGTVQLQLEGAEEAQTILINLLSRKQALTAPSIMSIDTSSITEADSDISKAISSLQEFITLSNNLEIETALGIDTSETQKKLQNVASDLQNIPDEVKTKIGIDGDNFENAIKSITDTKIDVKANVSINQEDITNVKAAITEIKPDEIKLSTNSDKILGELSKVESYSINDKNFSVKISNSPMSVLQSINSYIISDKSYTITAYKRTVESSSKAQGTANAQGTAYASGTWGTKTGGLALVGELGQELVVRNGRFFTIGDNGAELFQYQKDDIIFNAEQTKQILENGKITNGVKRGTTYAEGTAFSGGKGKFPDGNGGGGGSNGGSSGGGSSGGGSNNGSSSNEKEEEPQIFDWIEVKIDRIERALNKLKTTAESAFKSYKNRLKATSKEMSKITREIEVQEKAYKRYMKQADSVELSDDLKEKVKNGSIDISEYDEDTQKLIKDYQEWYEKALDCDEAVQKLHEDLAQLYKDNFDNIQEKFEHQLNLYDHLSKTYETGIKALEAKGYLASTEYYKALSNVEKKNIKARKKELADLEQAFSEAMASGEIEKGSDAWYEMQEEINKVKEEIDEANVALLEYQKTMREIKWSYFDYVQERIGQITQETDFLIDLMSDDKLFNDNGQLSDKGLATMGLRGENLNVYMAQADAYAEEILKLDREIAKDPYNTDLVKRREEMLKLQQDSIKAAEQEKQAIVDLVEQGIKIELENLKALIDAYTNSLDSAKNLYEYQKKIKSQTSDIAKLQKQLMAYTGDTSEENRARVQKITVDLAEAQEKLAETEYEQFISETKKLLDELYSDYEEILNERLDNVDALIGDMIDNINENSAEIAETIKQTADEVGYTISDENKAIWSNDGAANAIISKYGDNFSAQFTTVNQILSSIEAKVAAMVKESDKEAKEDEKSTKPTTDPKEPDKPGDGLIHIDPPPVTPTKPKRTDKDNYGVALAIINGNYGWGSGNTRKKNLEAKGFDYNTVQGIVNKLIKEGYVYSGAWVGKYYGIKDLSPYHIKKFKLGGLVDYTGLAQLDGTPDKPELVLNSKDTENYMRLTEALRRSATTPLTYSGSEYSGYYARVGHNIGGLDMLSEMADKISKYDNLNTNQNITVTFGDIVIDHVEDYNDFVNQLKEDKQFEKMINAMTTDRLLGGSSFAKNKYRWN